MSTEDTQQADTLDDELKAAWDASEEPEDPATETEQEEAAPETEGGEESEEAAEESEEPAEDDEGEEPEGEEEADEPDKGTIDPPQDWPDDWAKKFRQLDDNGRQVLLDAYRNQQADYTRKTQEVAEIRKAIPDDTKQQLQLHGVSEGQYVTRLAAADRYLQQSPQEAIQWLAKQYGVDLRHSDDEGEDYESDPELSRLKNEVTELRSQLQQREQREYQTQQQTMQQQVDAFAQAQDEQGQYKHPHFEEVKAHMSGLLQAGAAQDLESAYEQAVWARPDLRQKMLTEQQKQQEQKAEASRKKKAAKAKRATTPAGSGSTATEQEQPNDLRTDLERLFDEQST